MALRTRRCLASRREVKAARSSRPRPGTGGCADEIDAGPLGVISFCGKHGKQASHDRAEMSDCRQAAVRSGVAMVERAIVTDCPCDTVAAVVGATTETRWAGGQVKAQAGRQAMALVSTPP